MSHPIRVRAPGAGRVEVCTSASVEPMLAGDDGWWHGVLDAPDGTRYWLSVDQGAPLYDPGCWDFEVTPEGPRSILRSPWQRAPQGRPLADSPVVYELHVKGFGGGYLGCIDHLDHVVASGANVVELMPVHPFDDRNNYWGYMPLVWGAVHRNYATDRDHAAEELAELVGAAHDRGLHVWIDVVYNHTGEDDPLVGGHGLRGLDPSVFRRTPDGRFTDDSGCGNDIDAANPWVRDLVIEGLDRYADLGVDGFRFDLASLLTRDRGGLVSRITEWAAHRGVMCIAEPWDLGGYQLGHGWPWPSWLQWNDRFRDQVRGFLRGEAGLVRAMRLRVQGSPDLLGPDGAVRTLNFLTAHDGLTMHDLTTVTSDRHHSWDCGDDLRLQQLKNYFAVLLLSAGTPMWVMGDEFARTQHGHDNPYDVDGPLTSMDWSRTAQWSELAAHVKLLTELRRRHALASFQFFGVGARSDESWNSHSIAWNSGDLYVMANAWWEPLTFEVQVPGPWRVAASTSPLTKSTHDTHDTHGTYVLAPRSILVLER